MKIGDLVIAHCPDWHSSVMQKYDSKIGIVISHRPRWPGGQSREPEMIVEVFYPELGTKEEWGEYDLESVSENR